jgi:hypothetical protein
MWVIPESLAAALGGEALEAFVHERLLGPRSASLPGRAAR